MRKILLPCIFSFVLSVSVYSQAPVALFSSIDSICPGFCTDFTNLSTNATSFQWTFAGANPSTSTDYNPVGICYNTPGNYNVILIATGPGGSDTAVVPITVYPYPNPQGVVMNGDTLFANQGFVSYQWYINGNVIPGATDYFYVTTTNGFYVVISTDINGCEVEGVYNGNPWGIDQLSNLSSINIFPNPVSDILEIENMNTPSHVLIYNNVGQKIFENSIEVTKIDCRRLDPGIYWLEIISGGKTYRTKFMKQ